MPFEQIGATTIRFRARDSDNRSSAWQQLDVRLVPVADRLNAEWDQTSFSVGVPVGTGYTFSATGLPEGVAINSNTGLISGTVGWNTAGVYTAIVTETGAGSSSSVTFQWKIVDYNGPPVVRNRLPFAINPGPQSNNEGDSVTLPLVASDPDLDPLTYDIVGLPAG